MSSEGAAFLASRARNPGNALGMLDMLGRQAPAPDHPSEYPPDRVQEDLQAIRKASEEARPRQRIMLSWGPRPEVLVIGLEVAPDWDIEESWEISRSAAREVLPILNALTKVKDLTGELKRALGPQAVQANAPHAPDDPRPAREPTARQRAYYGRGRKDRPDGPAVVVGPGPHGPSGGGQDEALVRGESADVPQTRESGG